MKYSLIIQDRFRTKKIWDCASIVTEVAVTTQRVGAAGIMRFTVLKTEGLSFFEGDPVSFRVDNTHVFSGFVFTKRKNHLGAIEVTCYDNLRYLKARQSYVFEGMSASNILRRMASEFELDLGTVDDTGYAIPSMVCENKNGLDILGQALEYTTASTGNLFTLYEEDGKISLRDTENCKTKLILGNGSCVSAYTYTTDIDSDTYNAIKLVRPETKTGSMQTAVVQDSCTIKKWGKLEYYQTIHEDLNQAQLQARAQALLKNHNRTLRSLTLEAIGMVGLRAGQMIFLDIPALGDIRVSEYVVLDKVAHSFKQGSHQMKLEMRALHGVD